MDSKKNVLPLNVGSIMCSIVTGKCICKHTTKYKQIMKYQCHYTLSSCFHNYVILEYNMYGA
jgi:hypothetical protein